MSNDYQFLFPSVIHYFNVKDYNKIKKKLIKFAYNERKGDRNGVIISNIGGWQSKSTYASSDNLLQQTILESVSSYFSNRDIFNTGKTSFRQKRDLKKLNKALNKIKTKMETGPGSYGNEEWDKE